MATIQFKGKVQNVYTPDDELAYQYIKVPDLQRKHCNMQEFRKHSKYTSHANSDLFPGILARIKRDRFKNGVVRLDDIPEGVQVDTSGHLATVTLNV